MRRFLEGLLVGVPLGVSALYYVLFRGLASGYDDATADVAVPSARRPAPAESLPGVRFTGSRQERPTLR